MTCAFSAPPLPPSDHADPLVLNPLRPPREREPRITDLHVFLDSDQNGQAEPKALVLSLCVFPSLPPVETRTDTDNNGGSGSGPAATSPGFVLPRLDLSAYEYRICIDLHPRLGFERPLDLVRYGATIQAPSDICAEVTLSFALNDDVTLRKFEIHGLEAGASVVNGAFTEGAVNVRSGIFDDPFIFPRFFRTNVIGVVCSIPLDRFPIQQRDFLVWAASTKDGEQVDHVGRSQRTQLPRFDGLNTIPPSEHVAEIIRRHHDPTLMEDVLRTFLSPMFATRPFDMVPDVLVFSRRSDRPTLFPNGRKLSDDVTNLVARGGDTQLFEAANTDDPAYDPSNPVKTRNDKAFQTAFPYLAAPWTREEVAKNPSGVTLGRPTFTDSNWRKIWFGESLIVTLLVLGLALMLRSGWLRVATLVGGVLALVLLGDVYAANRPASDRTPQAVMQPGLKLSRTILGVGVASVLGLSWLYLLGRRHGQRVVAKHPDTPRSGEQSTFEDRQYQGSTFDAVYEHVFREPYYRVWGGPGEEPLPRREVTFGRLVRGWLREGGQFALRRAAERTVASHADLRWGPDGKGFARLLHPNGVCLAGEWIIDDDIGESPYTGCFRAGARAKIIARYSTAIGETRGGHWRSLSLVGKLFVPDALRPANFFTQEDIGGTRTNSFREAELTNSPPVTPWRRGAHVFGLLVTGIALSRADARKEERQLYEIAELGKPVDAATVCPRFIRLTAEPRGEVQTPPGVDFRDEILDAMYDRGDPHAKRTLTFTIEVSDEGERSGRLVQRVSGQRWRRIGRIVFSEAVASYNGDFVIHFHHAPWRNNRNDPASLARPPRDPAK